MPAFFKITQCVPMIDNDDDVHFVVKRIDPDDNLIELASRAIHLHDECIETMKYLSVTIVVLHFLEALRGERRVKFMALS